MITSSRHCKLAVENDRRRLLRRYLNEWQLWCRMEKEQRELLSQQQETRRKMAALINAASTGKLKTTETPAHQPVMATTEASNQPESADKVRGALSNSHIVSNNAQRFMQCFLLMFPSKNNFSSWRVTQIFHTECNHYLNISPVLGRRCQRPNYWSNE